MTDYEEERYEGNGEDVEAFGDGSSLRPRITATAAAVVVVAAPAPAPAPAPMISAIPSHSVVLVTMKESRQKAGQKTGREAGIRTVTGKGKGTGIKTRIGKKAEIGTGKGSETKIVIGTETVTGSGVRDAKEAEIETMMIITGVEIMIGGEITTEIERIDIVDTDLVRTQEPNLNIDQDHVLVHGPKVSGFDMAPPASAILAGAAAVTAGQVPGTTPAIPGMFQNMFPLASGQFGALPVMPVQAMTQQATRHARRVYVGGLSPTANEQSVATFFSHVMSAIGGNTAGPGDAVVNVYINHEKKFAFVEMRSVEEASNAMALDGIIFEGAPVKVRRPSDYNPSLAATLGPSQPNPNLNLAAVGLTPGSAGGLEGPDRIFVGGLPYYFTEAQVRELLESFGALRGFDLVKDRETGNSKGYAFCVYQDLSVTDIACAALNGIKMGDKTLTVRRANQGQTQPKPEQESVLLHAQQQIALQRLMLQPGAIGPTPTKVLCLTQVVTEDELKDDEDYQDILDDMKIECEKFGKLVNVVIPRPNPNGEPVPGVGKVFLEYEETEGSTKARAGLNGRKFGGNPVVASFYPENKFSQGEYDG
ncbi:hypothetical protein OSB04_007193 [Centaurea solstitialis]|uniref:Splicing factor U2af large subunit n=1 Tax=Centaurea solstitialis TaxID=347529 RepID=A0AA38TJE1_9ASTR|nr:hypothetical protein OSB04_007193 [Centaurea solstitialis]